MRGGEDIPSEEVHGIPYPIGGKLLSPAYRFEFLRFAVTYQVVSKDPFAFVFAVQVVQGRMLRGDVLV